MGETFGRMAVWYSKAPGVRALVKLVPGGGALDGLAGTRAEQMKRDRQRFFFDALATGDTPITEALLESEDFLHCFFRTQEAVQRTHQKEKIELFGKLLRGSLATNLYSGVEQYEELIDGLNETSLREFKFLHLAKGFEKASQTTVYDNPGARLQSYWEQFKAVAMDELQIEEAEFTPFVQRLFRTGFFAQLDVSFYDSTPTYGVTTRQFEKLCEIVAVGNSSMAAEGT